MRRLLRRVFTRTCGQPHVDVPRAGQTEHLGHVLPGVRHKLRHQLTQGRRRGLQVQHERITVVRTLRQCATKLQRRLPLATGQ